MKKVKILDIISFALQADNIKPDGKPIPRLPSNEEEGTDSCEVRLFPSRPLDRPAVGSPGRLLVFNGLLCLGHLSRRQLFVYQYHTTTGAGRKMDGENDPGILEPDRLNFHGDLAPIADPAIHAVEFRPFRHNPGPRFISILWE